MLIFKYIFKITFSKNDIDNIQKIDILNEMNIIFIFIQFQK